jgi:hypothetical protein
MENGHAQSEVAARPWTLFKRIVLFVLHSPKRLAYTSGCNYNLCTSDDGCVRHPKHVE